jgi:rubrerythrin
MGKSSVGGRSNGHLRGSKVLDEIERIAREPSEYVEFVTTGAPATGAFHCSACGYGVTVQSTLPQCPMCNVTTWERARETPQHHR